MALSNLYGWNDEKETQTAVACGTACGTSDKPAETPSACGSACGASDK
ncbi:MAG: ACGX-repeat peptide [Ruminococcus sp.]|nr:ACGX-repeat peptide [Ruminococcus sp.]